ncbi:MAG TPA: ComEC/Rec2 family competence protein, partial [Acidobacteriota bacterium]|nr:ComEC/Rec2 family competence protein [Acidobacteriota bacterium]
MPKLLETVFNRHSSIVNRQSSRPVAAITISFSLGIAASLLFREYSFFALVVAGISLAGSAFLALRKNRLALSFGAGLAAIAISGLLMALAHRDGFSDSDLRYLLSRRIFPVDEPVSFEGCVVEDGSIRGGDSIATVELDAFLKKETWIACKGKGILRVALPGGETSTEPRVDLVRGDRIRGWAVWQKPRNYENPGSADRTGLLARRGVFILGRTKSTRLMERIPGGCSDPWTRFAAATGAHVRWTLSPIAKIEKGQPAAVLASLVIGDYSGLNNTTRETFQNSGTYHVLVVSGLHVAWIAGLLLQFFKLIRLPERTRYCIAAFAILLYTCVVGFQASITRCLWMFLLYLAARIIFRHADAVNILFAAALILLVAQPDWLFEAGFQLSFLSVAAIAMTTVPAMNRYFEPLWDPLAHAGDQERLYLQPGPWHRRGRWLRIQCEILAEEISDSRPRLSSKLLLWICRCIGGAGLAITGMIVTSVSVQLWLEPLLAFSFNRMSWISPLANLMIVPFSSMVLASGIAASLTSGIPWIGPTMLALAENLASILLKSASQITTLPGAWQRCPTPALAWVLGGITLLWAWSFFQWRRFWIPCAYVAALLAFLSCNSLRPLDGFYRECVSQGQNPYALVWSREDPVLSLTFLDVGQGDSIVICFPDKRTWLLDAGGLRLVPSYDENTFAFDVGEAVVSRYLWHQWVPRLDMLILSHSDQDHAGGMPAVIRNFRASRLGYAKSKPDAVLEGILQAAGERGVPTVYLHAGMRQWVGTASVGVLHPRSDSAPASSNENSVVIQISYGRFTALLTGDLEKGGERELLEQRGDLRSSLLKVAHHGSRYGTSHAFLERVQPRWAVVSVGRNNPFGHPSAEVMARLRQHKVQSFLTQDEGATSFETNGIRYVIKSYR